MNHFQNNLKRIRKEAGLRQIDVAEKLGHTSADRISHWEKGLAAPGLINLFKLSIIYAKLPHELYEDLYGMIVESTNARGTNSDQLREESDELMLRAKKSTRISPSTL